MKRVIFSLLLIILFIGNYKCIDNPYTIEDYNIRIKVLNDGSASVKEKIKVVFDKQTASINKYISYDTYMYREDGSRYNYEIELSSLNTNTKNKVYLNNGEYLILLENPNPLDKEVTFNISYNMKISKETLDEFNIRLIEPRWSGRINNASFEIIYPVDINENDIYITTGTMYSDDTSNIEYNYSNKRLTGKIKTGLNEYESLILRTKLNNHYFILRDKIDKYILPSIILMLFNLLVVYIIWNKYGKDYKREYYDTFNKPNHYNPLELYYISNDCDYISDKSLKSLIVYLASLGYIEIRKYSDKLELVKLKKYNGKNELERVLMRRLFDKDDKVVIYENNDLLNNTLNKIKKLLSVKENDYTIKEKRSKLLTIIPTILGLINMFISIYIVLYGYNNTEVIITVLLSSLGYMLLSYTATINRGTSMIICLSSSILLIFLSGFNILFDLTSEYSYLLFYYVFAVLTYSIIMILIFLMPRRSIEGNILYSKAHSFKEFLSNPSEVILKKLIKENKNYYNEVIPYAYAFDVDEKFTTLYKNVDKKFKYPKWYKEVTKKQK